MGRSFSVGRLGVMWIPPWCWLGPWGIYVLAQAHDSESFFFRVLGAEFNWKR